MRRLAATTLALALLLAGCAGTSKSDASASPTETPAAAASTASPADIAALASVQVAGDAGAQPKFTFTQPFTLTAIASRLITPGTGAKLEDGQILAVHYYAVNGADGTDLGTSFGAATVPLTMGDTGNGTEMNAALAGQNVGARILFGVPGAESTELMLIEIVGAKTVPDRAEGEAVAPVAGLPTVTLAADGSPTLTPVTGTAPTALVAQPLIKGSGAAVTDGQTVTVNYTGWLWDGTKFDSSWGGSKFTSALTSGSIIDGWIKGLVGQTVGSQVLLVIPPDLAYGATEQGTIPANSTLVFVVDILAAS
ncbi:MAG TPA: FKBP-type peptidyl-prolyl cis-trans isomerase [Cellulomonas sp.]|uniref:FKBP-type peptidyl-prolyl cis-trans isomerase n=1 Tax=Cellulomonas sp. TaxID=40001 RepID=UPI002E355187|nr:FKBP-type peptidyl-prolyl cis-trans isomerase [Cellulomonas sp.]HEX5332772.1 FKBP-type peptidyl-prolyl cis-trans isomerase [Cellulomonas sp.]